MSAVIGCMVAFAVMKVIERLVDGGHDRGSHP